LDSLRQLTNVPTAELLAGGPVRIQFIREDGIDAGGLAKDWFGLVGRLLLEKSAALLIPSGQSLSE
jgi:hypothetical protein